MITPFLRVPDSLVLRTDPAADAVVLTREGRIVLRTGEGRSAAPLPPIIEAGEQRLADLWLPGRLARLGLENLFPVLETFYLEPPKPKPSVAEKQFADALMELFPNAE